MDPPEDPAGPSGIGILYRLLAASALAFAVVPYVISPTILGATGGDVLLAGLIQVPLVATLWVPVARVIVGLQRRR